MTPIPRGAVWRKSSRSGSTGGQCVELARAIAVTGVRNSKNPDGPVLTFPTDRMIHFLSTVKASTQD